jgi:hypothetical protein
MLNVSEHRADLVPTAVLREPIHDTLAEASDSPRQSAVRAGNDRTHARGVRLSTAACFAISLSIVLCAITLSGLHVWPPILIVLGVAASVTFCLSTLTAIWRTLRGPVDIVYAARRGGADDVGRAVVNMVGNLFMACFGMVVAYFATYGFARGRQLRRFGKVLLPSLRPGAGWTTASLVLDGNETPPAGLADRWRENGKTEHASVAAFARLTLDLMALGAPSSLIKAANEDALDEIRHTELCFSLASALDGRVESPGPFPQAQRVSALPRSRSLALAKLAVDSLVDGALHEGVSARIIAKLSQRCTDTAIRAAVKQIAGDEGRHAAHGWAVTRWCLEQGGTPVAVALSGAVSALPKELQSQLPEAAADGGWERWGIHGHALEAAEYTAARAHLVQRVRGTAAPLGTSGRLAAPEGHASSPGPHRTP